MARESRSEDEIVDDAATGFVAGDSDAYRFSGELTDANLRGLTTVATAGRSTSDRRRSPVEVGWKRRLTPRIRR